MTAASPQPRSRGWPTCGSSKPRLAGKALKHARRPSDRRSADHSQIVLPLAEDPAARIGEIEAGRPLRYAIARREIFERFRIDGLIELDSNIAERAIRPQTITRKNSLFAGNDGGSRTWATIATLLQTRKMSAVDPVAWLT